MVVTPWEKAGGVPDGAVVYHDVPQRLSGAVQTLSPSNISTKRAPGEAAKSLSWLAMMEGPRAVV